METRFFAWLGCETSCPGALQAELVQSRRLPDGLIEVQRHGRADPNLFILEIATYPERRIAHQVLDDTLLVYLDRRVVPDALVLVLRQKGRMKVPSRASLRSEQGWTNLRGGWKVVTLWTIPAEELLAEEDIGLIPWVPLTRFEGPPEPIFTECRNRIDRTAPTGERENLLAVTQVLAGLRYNDPKLFHLLGGRKAMIESPVLQQLKAEWTEEAARRRQQEDILSFLSARFGASAELIEGTLRTIEDEARLDELVKVAARCPSLEEFRKHLSAGA